eukprot:gnl/Ergobibamus_cyprinoides/1363.p1 GENE.gnl/Ergobibamus_cyprinoides/1363~~gnl/Ergobibamus_cyprinoides/1363.p1  ORF type:complete len:275 (+),score=37.39 gnl/Ergobibamus_cyprinoides/1363:120-827(+)
MADLAAARSAADREAQRTVEASREKADQAHSNALRLQAELKALRSQLAEAHTALKDERAELARTREAQHARPEAELRREMSRLQDEKDRLASRLEAEREARLAAETEVKRAKDKVRSLQAAYYRQEKQHVQEQRQWALEYRAINPGVPLPGSVPTFTYPSAATLPTAPPSWPGPPHSPGPGQPYSYAAPPAPAAPPVVAPADHGLDEELRSCRRLMREVMIALASETSPSHTPET